MSLSAAITRAARVRSSRSSRSSCSKDFSASSTRLSTSSMSCLWSNQERTGSVATIITTVVATRAVSLERTVGRRNRIGSGARGERAGPSKHDRRPGGELLDRGRGGAHGLSSCSGGGNLCWRPRRCLGGPGESFPWHRGSCRRAGDFFRWARRSFPWHRRSRRGAGEHFRSLRQSFRRPGRSSPGHENLCRASDNFFEPSDNLFRGGGECRRWSRRSFPWPRAIVSIPGTRSTRRDKKKTAGEKISPAVG